MSPNSHRLNGSLPKGVEAQNRTLFFKGPISYSLAGTYICEATNPIGTRSGQVEVNITGRKLPSLSAPTVPSPPASLNFGRCHCRKIISFSGFSTSPLSSGHWFCFAFLFLSFKGINETVTVTPNQKGAGGRLREGRRKCCLQQCCFGGQQSLPVDLLAAHTMGCWRSGDRFAGGAHLLQGLHLWLKTSS